MATVETDFEQAIANAVDTIMTGCILRIYSAAYAQLLSSHAAASVTAQVDSTVDVVFSDSVVVNGITNATAAIARVYASDGTTLLFAGFTVGASGADMNFDEVTPWSTDDIVSPPTVTFDLSGLTITVV